MSARILVVDDVTVNVRLLEAKLASEYFNVLTAFNGEKALELTTGSGIDAVSQILDTVAGHTYTITFMANADTPNEFSLIFGTPVTAAPTSITSNGFPGGFVQYSATAVAISNLTPLTFLGINTMPDANSNGHTVEIDDVSVESSTPTPEPASLGIFGLITLVATQRKRRQGFEISNFKSQI